MTVYGPTCPTPADVFAATDNTQAEIEAHAADPAAVTSIDVMRAAEAEEATYIAYRAESPDVAANAAELPIPVTAEPEIEATP